MQRHSTMLCVPSYKIVKHLIRPKKKKTKMRQHKSKKLEQCWIR